MDHHYCYHHHHENSQGCHTWRRPFPRSPQFCHCKQFNPMPQHHQQHHHNHHDHHHGPHHYHQYHHQHDQEHRAISDNAWEDCQ
ncbi:hypothetical protein MTP99_018099 [Tenebrio molitor]|nr:hypothetical protein MTP99_018099 [Tenebrio molitor]